MPHFQHLVYCANEGPRVDKSPHAKHLVMVAWGELARAPHDYGSADEHGGKMLHDSAGNTISCGVCGGPMLRILYVTPEKIAELAERQKKETA